LQQADALPLDRTKISLLEFDVLAVSTPVAFDFCVANVSVIKP
jgi:hypothetical protein